MSSPNLYELVHAPQGPSPDFEARARRCYDVVNYLLELGDGELMVLSLIAERLAQGRRTYGPLDVIGDGRDWAVEAGLEAADQLVYAAAEHLRVRGAEETRE